MERTCSVRLDRLIFMNPSLRSVLRAWSDIDLKDCWLVAGCLAQTVWNEKFRLPLEHGVSDLDLVYFDSTDLSAQSEQRNSERVRRVLSDLPLWVDVKNEARVHVWYEEKFGYPIAPYRSVRDAIDTFPTTATAVGVRPAEGGVEIYAPFGLTDMFGGIVRANKRQITAQIYEAKVSRWLSHWPNLHIVPWDESQTIGGPG
ncbi:hypothetical protein ANI02nite_09630 [Acetobacter nitrogenifigens DSM 23921 = NBRC 105050]|uniref:Nitrate reductase n=2 Tax=Acetobacter nitrogenifigens TaxID=285268 RepID=A0A511X805_9PROT|nr:hypothetical protein ANI02nite_09630 [Acetobacter nitrogenifigens DSM 23921 = NBRC 105050]